VLSWFAAGTGYQLSAFGCQPEKTSNTLGSAERPFRLKAES
jgi:hypothetical protein